MVQESQTAKLIRGLVKAVFIGCYAAFMWASIHHVATYFDNFEQNGASNLFGSYLLAGAFDVTALVTTIGVMFFRKSMPRYVQVIVWCFIVAIACYSFFVNWEYAAHFQSTDLVLQATGATTPVFDTQGHLHYVMVMRANTALLVVNPLLASGFTIFSLIYSIVAEFFGAKAPTVEELQARKTYLEQTAGVMDAIKQLEDKGKGKGLTTTLKERALEVKSAWKEVIHSEETEGQSEQNTQGFEAVKGEVKPVIESVQNGSMESGKTQQVEGSKTSEVQMNAEPQNDAHTEPTTDPIEAGKTGFEAGVKPTNDIGSNTTGSGARESQNGGTSPSNTDLSLVVKRYPKVQSEWLSQERKSVTVDEIVEVTKHSKRKLLAQVGKAFKTTPRNPEKILVSSVIEWLKTAPIPEQTAGLESAFATGKTGGNGHRKQTGKLDDLVGMPR